MPVRITSRDPNLVLVAAGPRNPGQPSVTVPYNGDFIYIQALAGEGRTSILISGDGLGETEIGIALVPGAIFLGLGLQSGQPLQIIKQQVFPVSLFAGPALAAGAIRPMGYVEAPMSLRAGMDPCRRQFEPVCHRWRPGDPRSWRLFNQNYARS